MIRLHLPCRRAKALPSLLRASSLFCIALLWPLLPATAQTCDRSGCGSLPAACNASATSVPSSFWGELQPTDAGPIPTNRNATLFMDSTALYASQNWFTNLDIQNGYLVAGISDGLTVWDLHQDPAHPTFVSRLSDSAFPIWAASEDKWPIQDLAMVPGDDTLAVVTGDENIGIGVVDLSNKSQPRLVYQNHFKSGGEVYATKIGTTEYGFLAAKTGSPAGGLYAFNLTAAHQSTFCLEGVPAPADPNPHCPGVYIGKVGPSTSAAYVHGVDNFIAFSSGTGGVQIWNVANPANPVQVLHGLDTGAPPGCPFATPNVYGVAMWKQGTHYYLGMRFKSFSCATNSTLSEGRIYDVSCISGGACSLGNPIWSKGLYLDQSDILWVTYSHANGSDYLYFGEDSQCTNAPQAEYLFDVTVPTASRDITPPTGYWGWYYRGNPTGFSFVMPRKGRFSGQYFYRAAFGIMDVHQRVGAVSPSADFSFSPQQIYPGDTVSFTDLSSAAPTSWSWSFGADGTTVGGTSTSSQNPKVQFAAQGTKTVSLTATNANGPSTPTTHQVTVLDAAPHIAGITVSPASPLQCQPVTLTATGVTGRPPLTVNWSILNSSAAAAPGGSSTANPFLWDTKANGAPPDTYTATFTASNGGSPATKSATFALAPLPALPLDGQFTPTVDPFTAGTVALHVSVPGATEWNWDFGDGNGFTGFTSDPVNGPNPTHTYSTTGIKSVRVQVRNCVNLGPLTSATLPVNIQVITPLMASFTAICPFGACSFNVGVVAFSDQSQGADHWDYDWTHTGLSSADCSFTDVGNPSAATSHTYSAAGDFHPCLRVHRGASETNVMVHTKLIHLSSGVPPPPPTLAIVGPTSGAQGQSLSFSVVASNCTPSSSWIWTFSGGTPPSSTSAAPSTSFAASGNHGVTVTNTGCVGAIGSSTVVINGGGGGGTLSASFTFSPATPNKGDGVGFDGSSSGGSPTLFSWQFGDGTTGSGKTVTHSYANAGNFSVTLTVCAGASCAGSTPQVVVVGNSGGPTPLDPNYTSSAACFDQPTVRQCTGQAGTVITLAAVTTQATSYSWDFGDGTTGSGPNVSHTWAAGGNFNVTLTVANSQTNASLTRVFKLSAPTDVAKSVILPWIAVTRGVLVQSSDLYVHNPGTTPMDVTLEFRRRGTPEDNPPRPTRTVAPGATLFSADVLSDLFGRPENTVGFVTVTVPKGTAPVITSYNTTFQTNGTQFGQTISGVSMTPATATSSNQASAQAAPVQQLIALNDNADEVSYFGLSNPNDQPATYRLSLFDNSGQAIGSPTDFVVARLGLKQFQREEIESLFNVTNTHDYRVQIDTVSGGQIYPYGAKLRTISFDPSFIRPGAAKSKVYVIGALSTPGLSGTLWRSDMVLSNPGGQVIQTTMSFISVGVASQTLAPVTVTLQPGETQRLANVVADKWGVTNAVGILTFDTDPASTAFPLVQGESYDFSTSVRRFGQSMPALADSDAAVAGQGHYMVGLRQDASHWTAFWLFNPSADTGTYDLVYRGLDGSVLGQITGFHLPPGKSKLFRPSEHPIPAAGVTGGFTVQIMVHNGKALAAGQVVNLSTNDPAYIVGTTR